MKIIKGNFHTTEEILVIATKIADKYFSHVPSTVAVFQSTRDFFTSMNTTNIPAITVSRNDASVTLNAHPFLEGILETFSETSADLLIAISDKGKNHHNFPTVIAHELQHVKQNVINRKILAQSQSLAIKLKNTAQSPHEKDAKLFEEKYFLESKTIPLNYDWVQETRNEFEQLKSDFITLLDFFIQQRKLPENLNIFDKQPEGLAIEIMGDCILDHDLDFNIHNLKIALNN